MRCRRRECLWWKIAMEVARGGNDHVYTRFKLLSYATQPAMMPFDDDYGWWALLAYKHAWNVWNFHENTLQLSFSCITLWVIFAVIIELTGRLKIIIWNFVLLFILITNDGIIFEVSRGGKFIFKVLKFNGFLKFEIILKLNF